MNATTRTLPGRNGVRQADQALHWHDRAMAFHDASLDFHTSDPDLLQSLQLVQPGSEAKHASGETAQAQHRPSRQT